MAKTVLGPKLAGTQEESAGYFYLTRSLILKWKKLADSEEGVGAAMADMERRALEKESSCDAGELGVTSTETDGDETCSEGGNQLSAGKAPYNSSAKKRSEAMALKIKIFILKMTFSALMP